MKGLLAVSAIAVATILCSSQGSQECRSKEPAKCFQSSCSPCFCLGPDNLQANPPVRPITCSGDFTLIAAATYWKAEQDGLEYGVLNSVPGSDSLSGNPELNNLIQAEYIGPKFAWNAGFKLGVAYTSPLDGWDVNALWTGYSERLRGAVRGEESDNRALIPLWSSFQYPNAGQASILYATEIRSLWKLDLNFLDIELGREYWASPVLSLRPHIGVRGAVIDQELNLHHKGGSFNDDGLTLNYNNEVELENDFKGVGARSGLDSFWNIGCGWGFFGSLATSILYGKFHIDHDEILRQALSPFSKAKLLETKESFRASRAALDLALGLQWKALICERKYGIALGLGWEQHLFFNQNQLWRVVRNGGVNSSGIFNNSGDNIFHQRRGALSTQGWTLTGKFTF